MLLLVALVMGIIEGITEFLPVSSTGHLILAGHLMNFEDARAATFEVFIQLGAIGAVLWQCRGRFSELLNFDQTQGLAGRRGLLLLGLTTLPALIVGVVAHSFIKEVLFNPLSVALGLAVGAVLILIFESYKPRAKYHTLDTMQSRQAWQIGLYQLLALWPGVSRAGATIIGGMASGLDRVAAVEYSFLAAVPVIVAAAGYDLWQSLGSLQASDFGLFSVGFITAFVIALFALRVLITFVQRHNLRVFAWYRLLLAVIVLVTLGV